jgi:hypothetical protein
VTVHSGWKARPRSEPAYPAITGGARDYCTARPTRARSTAVSGDNALVSSLPPAARAVAARITAAVGAARTADADELRGSAADLEALDAAHVSVVLGAIIRMLLEEKHPDGVDGDDLRTVLDGCSGWALRWLPEVDPEVLLVIVAGALGVHPEEADGIARPDPAAIALHAPLLVAHLLGPRSVDRYISSAYAEIARSETMD